MSLLRENKDELARLDAVAMGMIVSTHHYDFSAATRFDYFSEAWATIQGQASVNTPGLVTMTLRQPYGVVASFCGTYPATSWQLKPPPLSSRATWLCLSQVRKPHWPLLGSPNWLSRPASRLPSSTSSLAAVCPPAKSSRVIQMSAP